MISENQRGLVTTQQAELVGVPRIYLSRMDKAGDLERVIQGVYRFAGAPADRFTGIYAHWLALDPGRTAAERIADRTETIAVSYRSAAEMYGIGDLPASEHRFTCSSRKQTTRRGIQLTHRPIDRDDVRIENSMLVTNPGRTIADLYEDEPDLSHVSDVFADAIESGLVNRASIAGRIGETATDELLAYRGLDPTSLATQVFAVKKLAPVVTRALMQDSGASNVTESAVERALVDALAGSEWTPLFRASQMVDATFGANHA